MLVNFQMPLLLALEPMHWLFIVPISLLSIFLTLLILVQRGRGGGLTGALGGMGGQSAFGTKAGDVFTKITVVTALLWIVMSMGALRVLHVGKLAKSSGTTTPAKGIDTPDLKTDDKGAVIPGGETPAVKPDDKTTTPDTKTPETTTPETKAPETPKADPPATPADAPKSEAPPAKSETPATEAPKTEAPKAEPAKTDEEKK
ncbi:preprotein translocase subunit SecG [Anatilimnocola sp. NA78]|uniref:preprotein translocase subunit SecG n=1 Tax=Anatilimnocola sp. NA78 TaxID=3415683 RepID=UPI003CE5A8F8